MKLTIKEELFCQEYLKNGNATQAYKNSYNTSRMKPKSINETASALKAKIKIASRIDELRKILESEDIADAKEIQKFYTTMMRNEEEESQHRIKASELQGKAIGLFDKKEEKEVKEMTSITFRRVETKEDL